MNSRVSGQCLYTITLLQVGDLTSGAIHLSSDASDAEARNKQWKRINSLIFRQSRHVENNVS